MFVRAFLDQLYRVAGVLASLCLIGILVVIVAEMVTRWLGVPFPGAAEYAGYLMAASSFLAFAYALNKGAHIRVSLLLNALQQQAKRWLELWCYAVGSAASCYLAYHAFKLAYFSYVLKDFSQGQDETPMWIPQLPFAIGAAILAIAFVDNLVRLAIRGRDNVQLDTSAVKHIES